MGCRTLNEVDQERSKSGMERLYEGLFVEGDVVGGWMWVWVPCVMRSLDASLVWMWTSACGCVLIQLECGSGVCAIRKYECEVVKK